MSRKRVNATIPHEDGLQGIANAEFLSYLNDMECDKPTLQSSLGKYGVKHPLSAAVDCPRSQRDPTHCLPGYRKD
eukprot:654931-Amphidinium_carterae.1